LTDAVDTFEEALATLFLNRQGRASNKLTIHVATLPSLNTGYCAEVLGSCWERPIPSRSQALRRVVITLDLLYLIPLMVYSFIRPSDLKTI